MPHFLFGIGEVNHSLHEVPSGVGGGVRVRGVTESEPVRFVDVGGSEWTRRVGGRTISVTE